MKSIVNRLVFLSIISNILLSSCCHELKCATGYVGTIGFVSFTNSDLNTFILRRFTQGSNFTIQKDSVIIDSFHTSNRYQIGDTIFVNPGYYSSFPDSIYKYNISASYDFEVFIPATNTITKIDKITQQQTQMKSCVGSEYNPSICYNTILSYNVNGASFQSQEANPIIYIFK